MSNYSNAIGMMSQGTKFMYIRLVCGMQVFAALVGVVTNKHNQIYFGFLVTTCLPQAGTNNGTNR